MGDFSVGTNSTSCRKRYKVKTVIISSLIGKDAGDCVKSSDSPNAFFNQSRRSIDRILSETCKTASESTRL
jgi:hypothetical protein